MSENNSWIKPHIVIINEYYRTLLFYQVYDLEKSDNFELSSIKH
jgi:hypothetical protein